MAGFFHVRTSSDPPIPHPIVLKLEQDLHILKTSLTSSHSPNAQTLCNAFRDIGDLYRSFHELLCLPTIQQSLGHPHQKKWVEEQLDASIKFLDLISSARDCMALMREHVHDLRLAIRKKGDNAYVVVSQKKLHRETRVCFKLLKQIDGDHHHHHKCGTGTDVAKDWDWMMIDRVLVESKDIVIASVRSLMCLLSSPQRPKANASLWASTSKGGSEAQDQLDGLEGSIDGIEHVLEILFRTLIQNRVLLLNIVSL